MSLLQVGDMELHVVLERVERFMAEHSADVVDAGVPFYQLTGAASGFVLLRRDRSAEHMGGQFTSESGLSDHGHGGFQPGKPGNGSRRDFWRCFRYLSSVKQLKVRSQPLKANRRTDPARLEIEFLIILPRTSVLTIA